MKLMQSGNVQACKVRVCMDRWFAGMLFQPCYVYLLAVACSVFGKTGARAQGSDIRSPESTQNAAEILGE